MTDEPFGDGVFFKTQAPDGSMLLMATTMPALCLDFDGTIRHSKSGKRFLAGPEDVALYPGVEQKLWEWRERDYLILGVSNQGGVAFGMKTHDDIVAEMNATFALFERDPFQFTRACYSHEDGNVAPYNRRSLCRKPDIGMLALLERDAVHSGIIIDWSGSLFVGDRPEDQECARRAKIAFMWAWDFFPGHPGPERDKLETPEKGER